jgi:hypothetical protein
MHKTISMEFQSLQDKQIHRAFSKKIQRRPDLPELGRSSADLAQIQRGVRRGGSV